MQGASGRCFSRQLPFTACQERGCTPYVGFKEADLLRAGCSRPDVIALSIDSPKHLKAAGVSADELLATDANGGLTAGPREPCPRFDSDRGAVLLREAGYTASELVQAGVHSTWNLRQVCGINAAFWS